MSDNSVKVIFLDVDGVLNCISSKSRCGCYIGIDDKRVARLRQIVEATGAIIILSSTWKHDWEPIHKDWQNEFGNYLDRKLKRQRLVAKGKTYEENSMHRGVGIIHWLTTHDVASFIILDDEWFDFKETGLESRVIKTDFDNPDGGLTEADVHRAIALLNGEECGETTEIIE